jgi:hypothetical protein
MFEYPVSGSQPQIVFAEFAHNQQKTAHFPPDSGGSIPVFGDPKGL